MKFIKWLTKSLVIALIIILAVNLFGMYLNDDLLDEVFLNLTEKDMIVIEYDEYYS